MDPKISYNEVAGSAVAYLGFNKGGGKFSLATNTNAYHKGAKPCFPIFVLSPKLIFWPKEGHGPMASPKIRHYCSEYMN